MIENTFLILENIGRKTEQNIWNQGVATWNDFLNTSTVKGIGKAKKTFHDTQITTARKNLNEENTSYFYRKLPLSDHWRLYEKFREDAVFLDIETSGGYGYITVVGLYDGYEVKQYVKGHNLTRNWLKEELSKYKLIVTFNGASFDIPVINRYFKNIVPEIPHVDLRHVCSKIGLTGGLKIIEAQVGIRREDDVEGMSGGDAVMLWDKYRVLENKKYLDLLLKYNAEDIINLKPLADHAVKELKNKFLSKNSGISPARPLL